MRKNLAGKTAAILAILVVFVYGIVYGLNGPRIAPLKTLLGNNIHLGLDLQGGTHLVLQVKVIEAVSAVSDNDVQRLEDGLKTAGISGVTVGKTDPTHPELIDLSNVPVDKSAAVRSMLDDANYSNTYDVSTVGTNGFRLTMKPSAEHDIEAHALQQSIETIRDRIDSLGVSEPVIQQYGLGDNEILVELPGISNPEQVRQAIQSTARLEIHAVIGGPFTSDQDALEKNGGVIPPDAVLMHGSNVGAGADQVWLLKRVSEVAGNDFRDATPSQDENGRPDVGFTLTTAAGNRFYQFTSTHINQSMAVVLDNKVREVANIEIGIRDSGRITGGFTQEQAANLSMMLRTGALPASIVYLEERTIGASLGQDSIRKGVIAAVAGMLAVMAFMLIYYRGAGINADLALFLNLIILLGFMGFTGSTLTLPGIAGVILTIGMGVDSNVLIFERVREEIHAGKTASAAVDQGFAHAWVTILDTHVTTIVSAAILFMFGTGPVKGFAVTLCFGLAANLFTAVFVSRVIFDAILQRKGRGEALSI
ncbi:MAG: protein translocase subunit SecD [Acidobacteriaceae bacterium]